MSEPAPTPLTDTYEMGTAEPHGQFVTSDFARTLERENAALKRELALAIEERDNALEQLDVEQLEL